MIVEYVIHGLIPLDAENIEEAKAMFTGMSSSEINKKSKAVWYGMKDVKEPDDEEESEEQ